jgi:two-component SAPR family response regulator
LPTLLSLSLAGAAKVTDRRPKTNMRGGAKGTSERLEAIRIRLLGGFEVTVGARTIEDGAWRLRKAANLIKLLALASGNRLHREQIMYTLWPNLGISAASNTDHQRFALICGQGRVSTASLNQAPRVRWMASRG